MSFGVFFLEYLVNKFYHFSCKYATSELSIESTKSIVRKVARRKIAQMFQVIDHITCHIHLSISLEITVMSIRHIIHFLYLNSLARIHLLIELKRCLINSSLLQDEK